MLNNDEANETFTNNLGQEGLEDLVKSMSWGERDNDEEKTFSKGNFRVEKVKIVFISFIFWA